MTKNLFDRRKKRTRFRVVTNGGGRPRLSVFRSGRHIYVQVIDDRAQSTIAAASTNEKEGKAPKTWNIEAASTVGKKPVPLPKGVTASVEGKTVKVKGPKGELKVTLVSEVDASVGADGVTITPKKDMDRAAAMWGMSRTLVNNLVVGVTQGFTERLEINGVGYRAAVQGKNLNLQLGFSHDVAYPIPAGISIVTEKPTSIAISGIDKQLVGQVAAEIRGYRPPEPYKGKGVKYADEYILRKEGKKK